MLEMYYNRTMENLNFINIKNIEKDGQTRIDNFDATEISNTYVEKHDINIKPKKVDISELEIIGEEKEDENIEAVEVYNDLNEKNIIAEKDFKLLNDVDNYKDKHDILEKMVEDGLLNKEHENKEDESSYVKPNELTKEDLARLDEKNRNNPWWNQ
jgi:hypothetical protein